MPLRYSTTAATLTRFSGEHTQIHRLSIAGGALATAWTVAIVNEDIQDGVARQAKLVIPPEYVYDNEGFLRTSVTVRNAGPWVVVSAANGTVRYSSFQAMMRDYEMIGATITMVRVARGGGTTTAEAVSQITTIVAISNQDASTTTLELEQRHNLEQIDVPKHIIERDDVSNPTALGPDADGKSLPLVFGRHLPYLPPSIYGGMTNAQVATMGKFGLQPVVSPAILAQQNPYDVFVVTAERVSSGLVMPVDAACSMSSWMQEYQGYATAFEGATIDGSENVVFQTTTTLWEGIAQYATMVRAPYVQMPIRCGKHFGIMGAATPPKDPEHAIDGKPETTSEIYYSAAGFAVWQMPTVRKLGRIVYNTRLQSSVDDDPDCFEKPGPQGITPYAIVASQSGTFNVTLRMRLVDVHATLANNFFGMPVLGEERVLTLVEGVPQVIIMDCPVSDSDGNLTTEGWNNTKWEDWDFSTLPEGRLYGGSGLRVDQIGLALAHRTNGAPPVHVVELGFLVAFRSDPLSLQLKNTKGIGKQIGEKPDPYVGPDRPGRRRGRNSPVLRERTVQLSPYLGELYFGGSGGYRDTAGGTYTGTANKVLVSPASFAHYLLAFYANENVVTVGLGAASVARTHLDTWADWVRDGAAWTCTHVITEPSKVVDELDNLTAMMPDGSQITKIGSAYGIHVWIPNESSWSKWRNGTALHPTHLMQGDQGLAFQIHQADRTSIVNYLTVSYDYDPGSGRYRRTASCSLDGSDDGYGTVWANIPTTSISPTDLCQASESLYGREYRVELNYPGVRDPAVAVALGLSALMRRHRQPITMNMMSTLHCYDLRPWQVIRMDDELESIWKHIPSFWPSGTNWESIWWRCTRVEQAQGTPGMTIEAEWYPRLDQIGLGFALAGAESGGEDIGDLDFPLEGP